jgi:hypothetical protein
MQAPLTSSSGPGTTERLGSKRIGVRADKG